MTDGTPISIPPSFVPYENDNLEALKNTEKYETLISDLFLKPNLYMRISINGKTVNRIAGWQKGEQSGIVIGGEDGSYSIDDQVICLPIPIEGLVLKTKSMFYQELRLNVDFVRPFIADDFALVGQMKHITDLKEGIHE